MNNNQIIESILKLLGEEVKRLKKKKKNSLITMPILRRPMGSMFFMDSAVSETLNEQIAIKPITKKFNHLKWKLNDFQKQFLDDFINISDESLKKSDFEYASKKTNIPIESLKSIKNTYGNPELSYIKPDVMDGSIFGSKRAPNAKELGLGQRELPTKVEKRLYPMNQTTDLEGKSNYEKRYGKNGGLKKINERVLPQFMYEWLQYYIQGTEKTKIKESKLLDKGFSINANKYKYVLFSIDIPIMETKIASYDLMSNKNLKELKEFENSVKQFNETFGTNFIIEYQYFGEDGFLKVVVENFQITEGDKIFNKNKIDMENTDQVREKLYNAFKSIV